MICVALCILLAFGGEGSDDEVFSFVAELDYQEFMYSIPKFELENSPNWSSEAEFPPLPPRKAIEIATKGLKMLEKRGFIKPIPKSFKWVMMEASLVPVVGEKWFWKIQFEEFPGEGVGSTGLASVATVVVMMNGNILEPSPIP